MQKKFIKYYFLSNSIGPSIFVLSLAIGLLYIFTDVLIDKYFSYDDNIRELFEKAFVMTMMLVFGTVMWLFLKTFRKEKLAYDKQTEKFGLYIKSSQDGIFVCDGAGIIISVNTAASAMTGVSSADLCGKNFRDLWAQESRNACVSSMRELVETGDCLSTLKYCSPSGKSFYFSVSAVRVDDWEYFYTCRDVTHTIESANVMRGLNLDLNRRVNDEVEILRKREYLIEHNKKYTDMGLMLSSISHHWRQPLNSLSLYIQDACETVAEGKATQEYLDAFEEKTSELIMSLSDTIDDFRGFFSPSSPMRSIHIMGEITHLLNIISPQMTSRYIDMEIVCGCEKSGFSCKNIFTCPDCEYYKSFAYGDLGKFRQAMLNLIYNSADAIEGLGHKGRIKVSLFCGDDNLELKIEDNGPGFPAKILENPFEPYRSERKDGTGLGLFMSRMVFEDVMGGKVTLQNTRTGALVSIVLPRCEPAQES